MIYADLQGGGGGAVSANLRGGVGGARGLGGDPPQVDDGGESSSPRRSEDDETRRKTRNRQDDPLPPPPLLTVSDDRPREVVDDGGGGGLSRNAVVRTAPVLDDADNMDDVVDDLADLPRSDQDEIVDYLRLQYSRGGGSGDTVHVYAGGPRLLLALNPVGTLAPDPHFGGTTAPPRLVSMGMAKTGGGSTLPTTGLTFPTPDHPADGPHACAVADRAYRAVLMGSAAHSTIASSSSVVVDQSIVLSGPSGSGKTVAGRRVMRYLAALSSERRRVHSCLPPGDADYDSGDGDVGDESGGGGAGKSKRNAANATAEQKLLQGSVILESFGNARTVQNDDSSRFGRYVRMTFDSSSTMTTSSSPDSSGGGTLLGAHVETYLLERSRLVQVPWGERTYHVFYQLLAGLSDGERRRFNLVKEEEDDMSDITGPFGKGHNTESLIACRSRWYYQSEEFLTTSQSGTYDRREGAPSDLESYQELRSAMYGAGFSRRDQESIFAVVVSCLHLMNVQFSTAMSSKRSAMMILKNVAAAAVEGSVLERGPNAPHLVGALDLLGLDVDDFESALCSRIVRAGGERHVQVLSVEMAVRRLESLVEALYDVSCFCCVVGVPSRRV